VGGGGWWVCKPISVLSLEQAEQFIRLLNPIPQLPRLTFDDHWKSWAADLSSYILQIWGHYKITYAAGDLSFWIKISIYNVTKVELKFMRDAKTPIGTSAFIISSP
jgi:hypothetical protein